MYYMLVLKDTLRYSNTSKRINNTQIRCYTNEETELDGIQKYINTRVYIFFIVSVARGSLDDFTY